MGGPVNFSCFTPISFQFRIHIMSITSDSDLVIVLHTGISSCKLWESKVETLASEYPEVGNILCAWLRGAKRRYSPLWYLQSPFHVNCDQDNIQFRNLCSFSSIQDDPLITLEHGRLPRNKFKHRRSIQGVKIHNGH